MAQSHEVALFEEAGRLAAVARRVLIHGPGHIGIHVGRCPCPKGRLEHVGTGVHGLIEILVAVVEFVPPAAAQHKREVHAFVGGIEVDVGFHLGNTRTGIHLVVFIEHTVAIGIGKAHVAGPGVGLEEFALAVHMGLHLILRVEDALCLIEIESTDGLAHPGLCGEMFIPKFESFAIEHLRGIGQFDHLIVYRREVETQIVLQTADAVCPVQFQFNACVAHLAHIEHRTVEPRTGCKPLGDEQVAGFIIIVVEASREPVVEETKVDSEVFGVGCLPLEVTVFQF